MGFIALCYLCTEEVIIPQRYFLGGSLEVVNMLVGQCLLITIFCTLCYGENIHIGAVLSSKENQQLLDDYVDKATARQASNGIDLTFNASSILMDSNPVRSALSICDKLVNQKVHVIIASHPPSSSQSPISVSYTCGYYGIPLIGIYARDSAFSDKVYKLEVLGLV